MPFPGRGEVWFADLDPTRGHEQAGHRPVLVVSDSRYNNGPAGLVIVLPITSTRRGVKYHVPVEPPDGGLTRSGEILCDAVRSISKERLTRRLGLLAGTTLATVERRLNFLLNL